MLRQTRCAYEALKKSGLKRGEFSAQTERDTFIYEGKRVTEYGRVNIVLWIRKERAIELVPAFLENGLDVTLFRNGDKVYYPHLSLAASEIGKLKEIDFEQED